MKHCFYIPMERDFVWFKAWIYLFLFITGIFQAFTFTVTPDPGSPAAPTEQQESKIFLRCQIPINWLLRKATFDILIIFFF